MTGVNDNDNSDGRPAWHGVAAMAREPARMSLARAATILVPEPLTLARVASAWQSMSVVTTLSTMHPSEQVAAFRAITAQLDTLGQTLATMSLKAASLLARTLALLSQQLTTQASADHAAILASGLQTLHHYLNNLAEPASPLTLTGAINAARVACARTPLPPDALFDPVLAWCDDQSYAMMEVHTNVLQFSVEQRQNLVFHLRKRFKRSLFAWLTDDRAGNVHALASMRGCLGELQQIGNTAARRLCWIADAFIRLVQVNKISPTNLIQTQLAQLDNAIRYLYASDDASDADANADANTNTDHVTPLLRQLLFHIGQIGARIPPDCTSAQQVYRQFCLDQWFAPTTREQQYMEQSAGLLTRLKMHLIEWYNDGCTASLLTMMGELFQELKDLATIAEGTQWHAISDEIAELTEGLQQLLTQNNDAHAKDANDDDSSLRNLLEEMHDGISARLKFIPTTNSVQLDALIGLVQLLLSKPKQPPRPGII